MGLQLPLMQLDKIQQEVDELSTEVDSLLQQKKIKILEMKKTETRTSKCLL